MNTQQEIMDRLTAKAQDNAAAWHWKKAQELMRYLVLLEDLAASPLLNSQGCLQLSDRSLALEISKVRQALEQHQNRATQIGSEQPWSGPRYRRSEDEGN